MKLAAKCQLARLLSRIEPKAMMAAGAIATLVLATSGSSPADASDVTAWGSNSAGQLADGIEPGPEICFTYFVGNEQRFAYCDHFAASIEGLHDITAVSAGTDHSLALMSDGTVVAWGDNSDGELGNGSVGGVSDVPVAVSGLSDVTAISAGDRYSLALLADGTVMAWGDDRGGELGNGTLGSVSDVPVPVSGLSGVTAISASEGTSIEGEVHSLALLDSGTVMSWGNNERGALGIGKAGGLHSTPVAVHALSHVVAIATGTRDSLALLENGTAMAWGDNEHGQLGNGTTSDSDLPGAVSGLSGATAIAAGAEHSLALLSSGSAMAWGANSQGQLGNGTTSNTDAVPVLVSGLSGATAIAAGAEHSLALLSDGRVEAWGGGIFGQLGAFGNGNVSESHVPVQVVGLDGAQAIAAGAADSLAVGVPFPSVSSVDPEAGPASGGNVVTITGVNLDGATDVEFGAASASAITVDSPTTITAVAPPGTGAVDVTVTTPGGTSIPSSYRFGSGDRYSYIPAPVVRAIAPKKGPAAGGTTITIKGTNLSSVSVVDFGSRSASDFTVNSPTSITAVSPSGEPGAVDVTVVSPGGTSATTKSDRFTWGQPIISGLSPTSGPTSGGTSVTVSGSGFAPGSEATTFKFGATLARSVDCSSATSCVVLSPAHKAGKVDVIATVNGKHGKKNPADDQYMYG
jgi:alpha-tubulin suppressor-like RCC1 family protein